MSEAAPIMCTRCVLTSSFPGISFDADGVCSVCRDYERKFRSSREQKKDWPGKRRILDRLCHDARRKGRAFDVLVPLSGGKDSMYVLYLAVKELGLRPLAFTLDNGYLTQCARDNIDRACARLGVEHVYYCMDPTLMQSLFALAMRKTGYFCSVCMRAINMATERIAGMYDIPLVFAGSAANVELPTSPEMFQPGDVAFVRNMFRGEELPDGADRLLYSGSLKRRIGYRLFWWGSQRRLRVCAWLNLPDYIEWDYGAMFRTIRNELGWQSPTGNDDEHIDCGIHKASAYLHNRRWKGSEIPRLTLAGLIMAGQMTRKEALEKLDRMPTEPYDHEIDKLLEGMKMSRENFDRYIDMGPRYVAYRRQRGAFVKFASAAKHRAFSLLGIR